MLYFIADALAEDDGSAWKYEKIGAGYVPVQVAPLSVTLLRPGPRVVRVGVDVLVDDAIALDIGHLIPGQSVVNRRAVVRGPQPEMVPMPDRVQLGALSFVELAGRSVVLDAAGQLMRVKSPYVLKAGCEPRGPSVSKIRENDLTVFSSELRDLLARAEPSLRFEGVTLDEAED